MQDHILIRWVILGAVLAGGQSLQVSNSPQRSSRVEWRTGKVGNRTVAVLTRRYDIERDRRSVLKDTDLRDSSDLWVHSYSKEDQKLLGLLSRSMLREEMSQLPTAEKEETTHKKRHDKKNRRRRRYKNEENRRMRRMRRKKLVERDEAKLNGGSSPLLEGVGSKEQLQDRRRGRRRGEKRKNRKNRKDKKKKKRKGSKNKQKRKGRKNRTLTHFPKFANETELTGNDACQYINLKQCTLKADIFKPDNQKDQDKVDNNKCFKRKRFLECMEKEREGQTCTADMKIVGNILALRDNIRAIIWTNSSCILTEALNG